MLGIVFNVQGVNDTNKRDENEYIAEDEAQPVNPAKNEHILEKLNFTGLPRW